MHGILAEAGRPADTATPSGDWSIRADRVTMVRSGNARTARGRCIRG
jgi:hypothetical protein